MNGKGAREGDSNEYPEDGYKDPEILHDLIVEQGFSNKEVANIFDVSPSSISHRLKEFNIAGRGVDIDVPVELDHPWRDEELMRRLYVDEQNSAMDISIAFDCSSSTVLNWLDKHGIERRGLRESKWLASRGPKNWVRIEVDKHGHVNWRIHTNGMDRRIGVHRLLAVSIFGFDAVQNKDVHHKNRIPWDNRPDNIELLDHSEHSTHHQAVSWLSRIRIAELYEHGEISSRDLAEKFGVSGPTVLRYHHDMYRDGGEENAS